VACAVSIFQKLFDIVLNNAMFMVSILRLKAAEDKQVSGVRFDKAESSTGQILNTET
jgi:hypothetical protein